MNVLKLPKQEDVSQFNIGSYQVSVVAVTDENREALVENALSMYLGEKCKYCGREYKTLADLKDTVYAGYHEHGRLACGSCWRANNPG